MITDEKTVWDYNRGLSVTGDEMGGDMADDSMHTSLGPAPRQKLMPIYPRDGVFGADDSAAILDGAWVTPGQRAAAADFIRFSRTVQGQAMVRARGYRDIDGTAAADVTRVGMLSPRVAQAALPGVRVLGAVQRSFAGVRKRARVMFMLDTSGSMTHRISGRLTKLSAAKHAVADALRYLDRFDEVGLAAFANHPGGPITPGTVTRLAPLDHNRAAFLAGLDGLTAGGETPLYSSVDHVVAGMAAGYDPNRINAVVLLSDGHNDTDQAGTRAELLARLAAVHRSTPILVFTLGYGHAADARSLTAIAAATGAHYYDAADPTTVDQVLAQDLITSL